MLAHLLFLELCKAVEELVSVQLSLDLSLLLLELYALVEISLFIDL